jgi:hypothetical protein
MLDGLATRYHLLPSEVLCRADTLDVLVMEVAMNWHNQQMERHRAKAEGKSTAPKLPQDQLKAMIDAVKRKER